MRAGNRAMKRSSIRGRRRGCRCRRRRRGRGRFPTGGGFRRSRRRRRPCRRSARWALKRRGPTGALPRGGPPLSRCRTASCAGAGLHPASPVNGAAPRSFPSCLSVPRPHRRGPCTGTTLEFGFHPRLFRRRSRLDRSLESYPLFMGVNLSRRSRSAGNWVAFPSGRCQFWAPRHPNPGLSADDSTFLEHLERAVGPGPGGAEVAQQLSTSC